MEGIYNDRSRKASKLNPHRDRGRYSPSPNSPIFDPHASPGSTTSTSSEKFDSPLIRYLRSSSPAASSGDVPKLRPKIRNQYHGSGGHILRRSLSPLSAFENLENTPPSKSPAAFKTPVKVEEEVIVMDGILVGSAAGAKIRSLSSLSYSDGTPSSSGSNSSFYKTEMCWSWENFCSCRYGSKCLFAHGKEELRPSPLPNNSKSEATICESYTSVRCTQGTKCHFVYHQAMATALPTGPHTIPLAMARLTVSPVRLEHATTSNSSGRTMNFPSTDWYPQDDGIKIELPPSASTTRTPSKEEVNAYICRILSGPSRGKRLPAFVKICPD